MEILKPEEYNKLDFASKGHSKHSKIYMALKKISFQEAVFILEEEWLGKDKPGATMHSYFHNSPSFKGKKFSIKKVRNPRKGWLIIRVL